LTILSESEMRPYSKSHGGGDIGGCEYVARAYWDAQEYVLNQDEVDPKDGCSSGAAAGGEGGNEDELENAEEKIEGLVRGLEEGIEDTAIGCRGSVIEELEGEGELGALTIN
jgi:hypothetical protein